MNTPLSTFSPALARLLLCGGGGLPGAWGPLMPANNGLAFTIWHGPLCGSLAMAPDRWPLVPLEVPGPWSLPLDPASPWPARMAVVAAHLLGGEEIRGASVYWSDALLLTLAWLINGDRESVCFNVETGDEVYSGYWNLPTLPDHLAQHPPEVALLLALYDVPEIKARVEALQ